MKNIYLKILNLIRELIAPIRCVVCGKYKYNFCDDCKVLLEKAPEECAFCRKSSKDFLTHEECKTEFYLNRVIVCYTYNDISGKLIEQLKYRKDIEIANEIVNLIIRNESLLNLLSQKTILVPIPLHRRRQKWRGFNQSEILADEIINSYTPNLEFEENFEDEILKKFYDENILLKLNLLKRIKNTVPQAKLHRKHRLANTKNAFAVNKEINISKDEQILLVDDVTTTGSTINDCAKVLRDCGFENISGLVFARGK